MTTAAAGSRLVTLSRLNTVAATLVVLASFFFPPGLAIQISICAVGAGATGAALRASATLRRIALRQPSTKRGRSGDRRSDQSSPPFVSPFLSDANITGTAAAHRAVRVPGRSR